MADYIALRAFSKGNGEGKYEPGETVEGVSSWPPQAVGTHIRMNWIAEKGSDVANSFLKSIDDYNAKRGIKTEEAAAKDKKSAPHNQAANRPVSKNKKVTSKKAKKKTTSKKATASPKPPVENSASV